MPARRTASVVSIIVAVAALGLAAAPAGAGPQHGDRHGGFAAGVVRLDGAQEAPGPGDPDGRGTFAWVATERHLCYVLTAQRIAPATAAHIHPAPVGVPGPVAVPLEAPTDGVSFGCIAPGGEMTADELAAIIADPAGHYVNVHNAEFPAGAIRAQLR